MFKAGGYYKLPHDNLNFDHVSVWSGLTTSVHNYVAIYF